MNVKSRKNVSVPNPADSDTGIVEQVFWNGKIWLKIGTLNDSSFVMFQAFVRDPDGYYIEFCNCQFLEKFLHQKMAEESKKWNFNSTKSVLTVGKKLKMIANDSKVFVKQMSNESLRKVFTTYYQFFPFIHF